MTRPVRTGARRLFELRSAFAGGAAGDVGWRRARDDVGGSVRLTVDPPLAIVVLDRPSKLNALTPGLLADLERSFRVIERDPAVRAVVVCGTGRVFCAGADLTYVAGLVSSRRGLQRFFRMWHRTFALIEMCPKPTVAAVHGVAFAGGFELTQVCDFVVMDADAQLGDRHAKLGLFPGGGSTQRLPRLIAPRSARWLLMSGDSVTADEALALGLASRIARERSVLEEAKIMAAQLAAGSADANAAVKRALRTPGRRQLARGLAQEQRIAVNHMQSLDAQIGFAAFRAREEAVFGDGVRGADTEQQQ